MKIISFSVTTILLISIVASNAQAQMFGGRFFNRFAQTQQQCIDGVCEVPVEPCEPIVPACEPVAPACEPTVEVCEPCVSTVTSMEIRFRSKPLVDVATSKNRQVRFGGMFQRLRSFCPQCF